MMMENVPKNNILNSNSNAFDYPRRNLAMSLLFSSPLANHLIRNHKGTKGVPFTMSSQTPKARCKISKRSRTFPTVRPGPEGQFNLPFDAGQITYIKQFLTEDEAKQLVNDTREAKSWARTPITFFGNSVLQPRDTAFFGTKLYSYSDELRTPTGWDDDPPASTALRELGYKIEEHLKLPRGWFNVILANRYHNGQDYMGWHSDNEKSLGNEPVIASISVGAERRFLVRPKAEIKNKGDTDKIEYQLANGSLLVMSGKMQKLYQHSLPKMALSKCDQMRLNFTYRRVVDESSHTKI